MSAAILLYSYLAFRTFAYFKNMKTRTLPIKVTRFSPWVLVGGLLVNFFFSLSFVYLKQLDFGYLFAVIGVIIAFI